MSDHPPKLICFGEILWDFLPLGLFPGGAPFNVAYHLSHQSVEVTLVSAVGHDLLGEELLRRVTSWGLSTDNIERHSGLPTGYVRAEISVHGDATYDITSNVAWDQITADQELLTKAKNASGIIFGSLSQRSPFNQTSLERLLSTLPESAWRIFDVNLRPPFDDLNRVRELARKSTLLKLNAAEAARLTADTTEEEGREESDARQLAEQTGCPLICITAGKRGAGLLHDGVWHWENAQDVKVADTIGAGDAFLAALVAHLISGQHPDSHCLAQACRIGEWVASQSGATPSYESFSNPTS